VGAFWVFADFIDPVVDDDEDEVVGEELSEPAGGAGGGDVGNTIAPRLGTCDAHRRLPRYQFLHYTLDV
jgi:hypothetical protein